MSLTLLQEEEKAIERKAEEVLSAFKKVTRFSKIDYEIKNHFGGDYLIIYLNNPVDRFFKLLQQILQDLPEDHPFKERTTILKKDLNRQENRLEWPETQLLRTIIAESLTVTEHSFADDFFSRYIKSVSGDEVQIVSKGNHIVYGRRGSGKSSLLAYLMHELKRSSCPYAWVTLQTYSGREDLGTIFEVLIDIINQFSKRIPDPGGLELLLSHLEAFLDRFDHSESLEELNRLLPRLRRLLGKIAGENNGIFIFLDDIHVISISLQPLLLDKLYSICRGNQIFLKISGIEQFVKLRDPASRQGLETPGDIQVIRLDYNLTMPDKSKLHIENILNAHAKYCGLQSINYVCRDGVLDRLVWVSAGVPRDALYLFSQGISESSLKGYKQVAINSLNVAASEITQEKLKEIKVDTSGTYEELNKLIHRIKEFCLTEKKTNVFLVEIQPDHPIFHKIEELIALRFLHILSTGFTPKEVGRRYIALMLDYGFYVGIRTAKSMELFSKAPEPLLAKELRQKCPTFILPGSMNEI
ncbi:MAG: AAA family ATPase [Prochlorotrichaceae cyanobacterium]|jgi:Cdc6-like AAA superfamily ATPase